MKRGEWSRALQRWGETPSSHPLTRPAVTLSPPLGEREGVRGQVHGKGVGCQ